MAYWRMQLHPNKPKQAFMFSVQSICAGFIGLDFSKDVGDLMRATKASLPENHRDYMQFAKKMAIGDKVLVIAHHFPVAIVTVAGDYNYIRNPVPHIGVWFRHFREISNPHFFADRMTNVSKWEQYTMTDTISPLHKSDTKSYQLIESWPSDS